MRKEPLRMGADGIAMGEGLGVSDGVFSKPESGKWFPIHLKGQKTTGK